MQLTKGAIGNLINRYKAVLKKCHLMNTFGSLAVAGMLIMGGAGVAVAAAPDWGTANKPNTTGYTWTGEETVTHTGDVYIKTGAERAFQAYQDGTYLNHTPIHTSEKGTISLGSDSSTIVISSSIKQGNSYGVLVFDNSPAAHSDQLKLDLTGDTISISAESKDGYAGALHVSSDVTVSDKDNNNTVNIVSKNGTTIYAKGTTGASAIELMSGGILNISGPLTAKAELNDGSKGDVIYARGGATLNIGANGETVKLDGNINFGYEGTTSGTGVDAFVNVTLTGADSYWNGNTITSWSPDKPSDGKLEVTSLKVALNKGATWTPTVVENSQSKDQQYTALNELTLDGGIVDVNKGVAITIENIDGKGAITNAGSVTIEKGTIEGPITFEKGDAKANNMVTVDKDGKTTLTGGVAGSGTIDRLAIAEDGKTTITNAKLSGHEGRALWNNGTLTINGGSFDGNKAGNGGAIYNATNATLKITGTSFTNNTAAGWGGAILNSGATITVTDATFASNIAQGGAGGAIGNPAEGTSSVTVSGTKLLNNHSVYDGGAIGNYGGMKIENCLFEGNTAQLDFDGEKGTWTKPVTDDTAVGGGAISLGAVSNSAVASISGTTFKNNTSGTNGGAIATRQAIHADNSAAKLDIAATFIGNKAQQGGAIYNSFYTDNGLGKGAGVTVTGTFSGNEATSKGGAIYNDGTLDKNSTKPSGGVMTITDATFDNNKADFGGAIFNAANGKLTFRGTNTFTGNTAAGNANDIYNAGTITVADGTTTLGSGLTQAGGEIFVNGGTLDMASGSSLSFDEHSTLTINGGTFVADFGQLLTDYATTNTANGITDESIIGTSGNLNLRLNGGYYTLEQYNAAKGALLGQADVPEDATLNFLNANLQLEGDQALVVGANPDGNGNVTIDMAPVVVEGNEAPSDALADGQEIPSVPNQIVSVVTDDENKALLTADTITVAGGSEFTAKGLQIDGTKEAEAVTLAVTDGSKVTLTGGEAGFTGVVNAEGDAVATNVEVKDGAALTVGLEGNENAQNLVLNEVTVADGTFTVAGNGLETTQVAANTLEVMEANGSVAVDKASLTVENAVVADGLLSITNTVADLGTVKATGGVLFFDPSYGTIKSLVNNELGSKLLVSDGSVVNVAFNLDDLQEMAQKAGFTTTPITNGKFTLGAGQSMLAVGQPIQLISGGQIVVDAGVDASGSINGTPVSDGAYFGRDSLLVVNGNTINGATAAIDLSGATTRTLNVENGAKLLIADAVAGTTYTIIDGETNTSNAFNGGAYADAGTTGWKGSNLLTSSDMLTLTSPDGTVFMAKSEDAHTVFPNLSHELATAVNTLYGQKLNDVDADAMGVRFLSRATDNRFLGSDKDAAAATIESAARIAFAGAVPQMTKMASDAGSNAVVNRLGFANPADGAQAMNAEGKIVDRNTTGFALWIAPLWQSQHGWGMEADNLDYGFNGNLGGVSLGADYTFENAIRAGITFNIGGGYAESSGGDLNSTENRMSFWGLGAYAGWNYENFGLMADVSYTSTWNDLKQDMDSRMGMGDLEADVQASAISAGLRAEYKLETSVLDVIPHIGVRYMSLNTWGFDAESNGGTVLEGDGFHQDIWTFPVGVTFTKDFTLDSGWSFKPSIDFSVIPAAGDIKAKQDVAFTGLPGTYEVETQMMDYLTWQGGIGLEMGNDTMSFGVNYTLQAGQHTTGHGVFGSFRYEF